MPLFTLSLSRVLRRGISSIKLCSPAWCDHKCERILLLVRWYSLRKLTYWKDCIKDSFCGCCVKLMCIICNSVLLFHSSHSSRDSNAGTKMITKHNGWKEDYSIKTSIIPKNIRFWLVVITKNFMSEWTTKLLLTILSARHSSLEICWCQRCLSFSWWC